MIIFFYNLFSALFLSVITTILYPSQPSPIRKRAPAVAGSLASGASTSIFTPRTPHHHARPDICCAPRVLAPRVLAAVHFMDLVRRSSATMASSSRPTNLRGRCSALATAAEVVAAAAAHTSYPPPASPSAPAAQPSNAPSSTHESHQTTSGSGQNSMQWRRRHRERESCEGGLQN